MPRAPHLKFSAARGEMSVNRTISMRPAFRCLISTSKYTSCGRGVQERGRRLRWVAGGVAACQHCARSSGQAVHALTLEIVSKQVGLDKQDASKALMHPPAGSHSGADHPNIPARPCLLPPSLPALHPSQQPCKWRRTPSPTLQGGREPLNCSSKREAACCAARCRH